MRELAAPIPACSRGRFEHLEFGRPPTQEDLPQPETRACMSFATGNDAHAEREDDDED